MLGKEKLFPSNNCSVDKIKVMLEDDSLVEDEEVFTALPNSTCFIIVGDQKMKDSVLSLRTDNSANQQRLTVRGGTLGLRHPTGQVRI